MSILFSSVSFAQQQIDINKFVQSLGLEELLIPFLLSFVIIYGILESTAIFKKGTEPNGTINALLALIISSYVIFFSPLGGTARLISQIFATGGLLILGMFMFVLLLGALSIGNRNWRTMYGSIFERVFGPQGGTLVGLVILVVILVVAYSYGLFDKVGVRIDTETFFIILVVLLVLIFFYVIARKPYGSTWRNWMHYPYPPPT